jgi:hypothetical protein
MKSIAAILIFAGMASHLFAECCQHCGRDGCCRKVCHLKCDVKQVTKTEYSCECEDFCVPCRSQKVGYDCGGECHGWSCPKPLYEPTSAVVHTRKKLVKHEVTEEVPTYQWTVETICPQCETRCMTCAGGKTRAQVEAEMQSRYVSGQRPAGPPLPAAEKSSLPAVSGPVPDTPPLRQWWSAIGRTSAQQ